ncbi:hypothetical protein Hanom_Chr10g00963311 [Helianthus anomalus]
MTVASTSFSNLPLWKKSLIALHTSAPTISQDALKNLEEYPSGPGAFKSSIPNIAALISSSVTAFNISSASADEICLVKRLWGVQKRDSWSRDA